MDDAKIEAAARAVQRAYLESGWPHDFSDKDRADDFGKNRDLYRRMAVAAIAAVARLRTQGSPEFAWALCPCRLPALNSDW